MATYEDAMRVHPLTDWKRWIRFAIELVAVSGILLVLVAYFAKSLSPEAQRAALLEAIRLTLAEPPHKDTKKAMSIALPLADAGNRDAQLLAGMLFLFEENKPKATEQLRKAEAGGSLYACRLMASIADKTSFKSANCGNPLEQGIYGLLLIRRDQPDYVSGIAFLEAGVANGDPGAHAELGRLLAFDNRVPRDLPRAEMLLRAALQRGEADAGFFLWTLSLAKRTGVSSGAPQPTDDIAACHMAAELGHAMCQHIVAIAQGLGIGLPRDDAAAYMWINLAAANPEADLETRERTAKARDTIESLLSSTQLAEAQRLTREWKPKKFEEPQELPFVFAMRQLRDEMDGKFPAVPNLKPSPAPVPASARFGGGWDVVSEAPAPLSDAEFGKMFDEAAANKAVAPARTPGPAPAPAPAPASHQDTPRSAPIIAAMERVEKKQTPPVTPIDFISQSLCGSLVKDRAALSAQSGGIQGCKKRQLGGRSDIAVDNTANDTAVLVKLYPSGVSQSAAVRVFTIPAYGSWTESGIRAGTYELRYEDLATKAFTKTEPLTLNEVQVEGGVKFSHLKVTLYKVRNGNMKTQPIAKGEFDD